MSANDGHSTTFIPMNITDLSEEDRPREKFEAQGADGLSTSELLAILIGSGNNEENAVQLMQRIMNCCDGSLCTLGRMSISELCAFKGVGKAKAITLLAACEVGRRRALEDSRQRVTFRNSQQIYEYFLSKMQDKPTEESHVMLLNNNLRLISSKLISRGGITGTVVDVRLILKEALLAGATNIVLCHNHPSGNPRPSQQDDALTEKVKQSAQLMDIRLLDHLIVTSDEYYSYQEEGRL